MALLTFGTNITQASGSAGGTTYSRNKGGAYMRARIKPVNPKSAKQRLVRTNFAANAKVWSATLTAAERAAWLAFAQANPLVNVLGASIIVSGMAMMMKLNQVLSQIGVSTIVTPPANLNVPVLAAAIGLSAVHSTGAVVVSTNTQAVVSGAEYYLWGAPPMAAGKKAAASQYRYLGTALATSAGIVITISGFYTGVFGSFATGQNIQILVATVNTASGAVTPALSFNTLAT